MLQKQYIFWANYFHSQTESFHVFSLNLGHSQLTIGVCWKCNCWKHCHAGTLAMWSSGGQNPSKYRRGEQSPSPFWKRPVAHPDWLTELAVSAMFHLQAWGKKIPSDEHIFVWKLLCQRQRPWRRCATECDGHVHAKGKRLGGAGVSWFPMGGWDPQCVIV